MYLVVCQKKKKKERNRRTDHTAFSRVHCRLLGLAPELGQRVHFMEGTNLRCREDPKPEESEERLDIFRANENREGDIGIKIGTYAHRVVTVLLLFDKHSLFISFVIIWY